MLGQGGTMVAGDEKEERGRWIRIDGGVNRGGRGFNLKEEN